MLVWHIIPAKEWGAWKKVKKPFLWFFTKEEEVFIPSIEYIVVDKNKMAPTIMTHPSNIGRLTNQFLALVGETKQADITMKDGIPVSYKLKEM